jgi:hypothetical protein
MSGDSGFSTDGRYTCCVSKKLFLRIRIHIKNAKFFSIVVYKMTRELIRERKEEK